MTNEIFINRKHSEKCNGNVYLTIHCHSSLKSECKIQIRTISITAFHLDFYTNLFQSFHRTLGCSCRLCAYSWSHPLGRLFLLPEAFCNESQWGHNTTPHNTKPHNTKPHNTTTSQHHMGCCGDSDWSRHTDYCDVRYVEEILKFQCQHEIFQRDS